MACGSCGGKAKNAQARVVKPSASSPTRSSSSRVYDVVDANGSLVASHSNLVTARAEARRSSGTVVPRSV